MKVPAASPFSLSEDESVCAWKAAQTYGCDRSLIEENLRLSQPPGLGRIVAL